MTRNYENYLPYLDEMDMSDASKRELIDGLSDMLSCIVGLAFDPDPRSQSMFSAELLDEPKLSNAPPETAGSLTQESCVESD